MTTNTNYIIPDIFVFISLKPIIKNVHVLNFIIEFCKQLRVLFFLEITRLQFFVNAPTNLLVLYFKNENRIINNNINTIIRKEFG